MLTDKNHNSFRPELWGGIECTVNRVGNEYRDQFELCGHYNRTGDLEKVAALGIKTLRYPILWEVYQPDPISEIDWGWADENLLRLQNLGIQPIAGLLHHGSGPAYTSLADNSFPQRFAAYAAKVATRFPWIEYYTPINEPLTTARFSGLYGLWFPHAQSDAAFASMFLNQMEATVFAMQAIRKVNPQAKLVQTEDLGKTYSTPLLSYQAEFENERRWLTFDLLCGKVNPAHRMWRYFIKAGITPERLEFFLQNTCPPDIIGTNYYITSERYLDENLEAYPLHTHGNNRKHRYADIEAVRLHPCQWSGLKVLLRETWERFSIPIAVTEVHLNCTREEQMRWFAESWEAAMNLRKEDIPILAVTAWSLFGAYDWNSLLTNRNNDYESGVFDIVDDIPRPTALAPMLMSLAKTGEYHHPLLNEKGWWRQDNRYLNRSPGAKKADFTYEEGIIPVLITGKKGTLSRNFERICQQRFIACTTVLSNTKEQYGLDAVDEAIQLYKPWAIIRISEQEFEGLTKLTLGTKDGLLTVYIDSLAPRDLLNLLFDRMIDGQTGMLSYSGTVLSDKTHNLNYAS